MAGVFPYNLNELLDDGSFLDNQLKSWRRKSTRNQRDLSYKDVGDGEMEIVERILLVIVPFQELRNGFMY